MWLYPRDFHPPEEPPFTVKSPFLFRDDQTRCVTHMRENRWSSSTDISIGVQGQRRTDVWATPPRRVSSFGAMGVWTRRARDIQAARATEAFREQIETLRLKLSADQPFEVRQQAAHGLATLLVGNTESYSLLATCCNEFGVLPNLLTLATEAEQKMDVLTMRESDGIGTTWMLQSLSPGPRTNGCGSAPLPEGNPPMMPCSHPTWWQSSSCPAWQTTHSSILCTWPTRQLPRSSPACSRQRGTVGRSATRGCTATPLPPSTTCA